LVDAVTCELGTSVAVGEVELEVEVEVEVEVKLEVVEVVEVVGTTKGPLLQVPAITTQVLDIQLLQTWASTYVTVINHVIQDLMHTNGEACIDIIIANLIPTPTLCCIGIVGRIRCWRRIGGCSSPLNQMSNVCFHGWRSWYQRTLHKASKHQTY